MLCLRSKMFSTTTKQNKILKLFNTNLENSDLILWSFKKYSSRGPVSSKSKLISFLILDLFKYLFCVNIKILICTGTLISFAQWVS
jgi:hypothetical protein